MQRLGMTDGCIAVFSPSMMTWVASYRGVLAFVNARGGGEYGDKWHDAGRLFHKQNVFDDVLAACKWLHESQYARKGRITICGGSNGGMGVGAVVNQCTDEQIEIDICLVLQLSHIFLLKWLSSRQAVLVSTQ